MEITFDRKSVCMADDISDHKKAIIVNDDSTVEDFLQAIASETDILSINDGIWNITTTIKNSPIIIGQIYRDLKGKLHFECDNLSTKVRTIGLTEVFAEHGGPTEEMIFFDKLKQALYCLKGNPKVRYNPWPDYPAPVMSVLELMNNSQNLIDDESIQHKAVEKMNLNEIKFMYNLIYNGEKSRDGYIVEFIENGLLYKIINRHMYLLQNDDNCD